MQPAGDAASWQLLWPRTCEMSTLQRHSLTATRMSSALYSGIALVTHNCPTRFWEMTSCFFWLEAEATAIGHVRRVLVS